MYRIKYCENHWYTNYETGNVYGGGTIYTLRKEFNSKIEAQQYAKEHEWEWDKNPQWNNSKFQIEKF